MKISVDQLPASLKKSLLPCYLVSGDEHLLVQESLDAIRAAARQRGFGAREVYVAGPAFDWGELAAAAGSLSLFAEKRILELRLPTGKPGREGSAAIADLVERLSKTMDDLVFIVSAPKLDRNATSSKWVKSIGDAGGFVQIWPVGPAELPGWIGGRMRRAGLAPDREAVQMIADRVEGNLLAAEQEIEKLRLILGEGPVSGADVDDAVADSSRYDIFKLTDAAVAGDTARAMRILGGVREEGVALPLVTWALARELRMLASLAENVQSGANLGAAMFKAGVWKNRQGVVRACISRHKAADFYRLIQIARKMDAASKGRLSVDPWQLAMEIVLALAAGRARAA